MGTKTVIAAAIALCLAGWAPAARAQKPKGLGDAVAVAGLRPARRANFEDTFLERLAQAQKLRTLVEEVIGEVTGGPVIVHKGLRVIVGKSYLVDFMNCEGNVSCVLRLFKPLKGTVGTLFFADYAVEKGEYKFRVRLVDLSSGKVLVELTYSVPEKDIEDRELWRKQLGVLFSTAGIAVKTPGETTQGGGEGGAGEGGAGAGGGEGGAGEGGGGGGEGSGGEGTGGGGKVETPSGETNSDELTDADFGPLVTQIAVESQAKADLPWIELSGVAAMADREFVFLTARDNEVTRPDGFKAAWTLTVGGSGKLYPFSRRGGSRLLDHIGVYGGYARADESTSGGRMTRLDGGASFRMAATQSETSPIFEFSAGYVRHDYAIIDREVPFPSVSYRGARGGIDMRLPLFTPNVALNGAARYIIANDAGAMSARMNYGDSRVGGLEAAGSLELRPLGFVFVRVGIEYTRFSFDFEGNGDLSAPEPIGARDRYILGTVATGLSL